MGSESDKIGHDPGSLDQIYVGLCFKCGSVEHHTKETWLYIPIYNSTLELASCRIKDYYILCNQKNIIMAKYA